ncbi:hypothetical protein MIR68_010142 [Amoeboaphelidium protococcarum]|nr:hypothetical protein MIR68_010142 [Amoeboaphelidium protococcarum]
MGLKLSPHGVLCSVKQKGRLTPFASRQLVEIFSYWQSPSSGLCAGRWSLCWFYSAGLYQGSSRGHAYLSIEPQLPVGLSFLSNGYEKAKWLQKVELASWASWHCSKKQKWCLKLESLTEQVFL